MLPGTNTKSNAKLEWRNKRSLSRVSLSSILCLVTKADAMHITNIIT